MVAIDSLCGRCGILSPHLRDLVLRKAIDLEIGETPPGIAEAWSGGRRHLVGFGGLLLTSDALNEWPSDTGRSADIGDAASSWRYTAIAGSCSPRPTHADAYSE